MNAFTMIVLGEFPHGPSEMALAERNHPVEAFLLDGSNEALRIRIRIRGLYGRQGDTNPRLTESLAYFLAAHRCPPPSGSD